MKREACPSALVVELRAAVSACAVASASLPYEHMNCTLRGASTARASMTTQRPDLHRRVRPADPPHRFCTSRQEFFLCPSAAARARRGVRYVRQGDGARQPQLVTLRAACSVRRAGWDNNNNIL